MRRRRRSWSGTSSTACSHDKAPDRNSGFIAEGYAGIRANAISFWSWSLQSYSTVLPGV